MGHDETRAGAPVSATFTLDEMISATGGRLVRGTARDFASVTTDTRAIAPNSLFVALRGERFDGADFVQAAAAAGAAGSLVRHDRALSLKTPDAFALIAVDDPLVALGALAHFHRRRFDMPVVGVGGSNGKTTTKEMIAAVLGTQGLTLKTAGNLNNEIGVPLTLLRLTPEHRYAVIEMGMNHPGEVTRLCTIAEPAVGILTSVAAEHLEGLGTIELVAEAEGELFRGLPRGAPAAVHADDPLIGREAKRAGVRALTFGTAPNAMVRLVETTLRADGTLARIAHAGRTWEVPLAFFGAHNAMNACGAWAVGLALGISPEAIAAALPLARGVGRRMRLVPVSGGGALLDDCYNANPGSMSAALQTLADLCNARPGARAIAVLGDMLELGPTELDLHRALGAEAAARGVVQLAAFGDRSRATAEGARAAGLSRDAIFETADPTAAATWVRERVHDGDVILVKGSRGMRLERVSDALEQALAKRGTA